MENSKKYYVVEEKLDIFALISFLSYIIVQIIITSVLIFNAINDLRQGWVIILAVGNTAFQLIFCTTLAINNQFYDRIEKEVLIRGSK